MTDVLVYGPSASGVLAAVAAASTGASVRLVGPGRHVGGMVSGGLGWTDIARPGVVGGLTRRFYVLVAERYGAEPFALRGPEPHVAEELFLRLLDEAGVELVLGSPLEELERTGPCLDALTAGGQRHGAAVFVDATYEGDLMAAAGVPYRLGREERSLHGERWAGRQSAFRPSLHNFSELVSPFSSEDDETLLPEIVAPTLDEHGWPEEHLGAGDGGLQAYQLRLCMTDRRDNQRDRAEPAGYDRSRFEVLRRYLALLGDRADAGRLLGLVPDLLPGHKCDVNSIGPFSLNLLDGSNRSWAGADAAGRAALYERHRRYADELLFFLADDPGVPEHVRRAVGAFWLCRDEFTDTEGWPHQLYVREARRMIGVTVLTEHDLLAPKRVEDTVATGSYNIDIREIERTFRVLPEYRPRPAVFNEGYLSVPVPPYPIPYRCLLPRPEDAENLLVPVCCSASHVAYGSVRTEPTLMALGEAAGAAAGLSATLALAPARLGFDRLRGALERLGG